MSRFASMNLRGRGQDRLPSKARGSFRSARSLRVERLEDRSLMSASPLGAASFPTFFLGRTDAVVTAGAVSAPVAPTVNIARAASAASVHLTNVPFVSQVLPSGHTNNLCQFASAAMLMGQKLGARWANQQTMESLARAVTGDTYGRTGANVPDTARGVEAATGCATSADDNGGQLTYDQVKQALKNGRAVSISLNYEMLGNSRASYYRQHNIHVGNHQVVVVGFSEKNQTWTILDPLQPHRTETVVNSATFHKAVDAVNSRWVLGWYFK
jgi:hypothetical protein